MGEWFADHDVAVVGADNIAVEATGRRGVLPPLHKVLVRDLGVTMLELLDLRAPGRGRVEGGLLVVAPLRISRGVGSPVEPAPHRLSPATVPTTSELATWPGAPSSASGTTAQGELPVDDRRRDRRRRALGSRSKTAGSRSATSTA